MTRPQQEIMDPLVAGQRVSAREMTSGFQISAAVPGAPPPSMSNFEIAGSDFSQVLEIKVAPSETITAEPGTMLYMSPGMALGADMGGCDQGCKRCCCAGESMFRLHMVNNTHTEQKVCLTPNFPAKIIPVDLARHSGMIFNRGAFLGAIGRDWRVDIRRADSAGVCCFGGQGLFMNTLHGNGMVFLNAGGTVMTKVLGPGEEIVVDHHSVLAFEGTVQLGIRRTGGCMVCCCAGQGLYNTVLTGPGFIMTHTMSLAKLRKAVGSSQGGGGGGSQSNQGGGA